MTVPSNTHTSYGAVGNREDLVDTIYDIATTLRPFQQNIKRGKATNTTHSWQKQSLRTPVATNYHADGDDTTATAAVVPTMISNYTQILKEAYSVSGTQQSIDAAGKADEIAYQQMNKSENLLNDLEMSLLANNAAVGGDNTSPTAREMAGALAWMSSNVSRGSGGSSGSYSGGQGAATNGTQRTFTEALMKTVLASAFTNGASGPKLGLMSATHKGDFSTFTGIADTRVTVDGKKKATIVGAADIYIGEFGQITAVPVQFGLTRDALFIDPDYWEVSYLRKLKPEKLAKTGDSEKGQMIMECTLSALNEKSSALVADLS